MMSNLVKYNVRIRRAEGSTKWKVVDTIQVDAVNRDTIPDALNQWIQRHGVANGDSLLIDITSET